MLELNRASIGEVGLARQPRTSAWVMRAKFATASLRADRRFARHIEAG